MIRNHKVSLIASFDWIQERLTNKTDQTYHILKCLFIKNVPLRCLAYKSVKIITGQPFLRQLVFFCFVFVLCYVPYVLLCTASSNKITTTRNYENVTSVLVTNEKF